MKGINILWICLSTCLLACNSYTDTLRVECCQPVIPVLTLKDYNPVVQLKLIRNDSADYRLKEVTLSSTGTTDRGDIKATQLFLAAADGSFAETYPLSLCPDLAVTQDTLILWVSVKLQEAVTLTNRIQMSCSSVKTDKGNVRVPLCGSYEGHRVGVALRRQDQDGVKSSRIPGLATSTKGTLLALYDARRESNRDLQGNIDVVVNRSTDGGKTWQPMQIVLDMGTWGDLPQRYNGVSDACILSDDNTGDLYVFGLWMHGILDSKSGKWIEGLTDTSTVWNHQWRSFGSQPGYEVKQSAQFLYAKSTDDGQTWSKPINITRQVKKEEWWLLAPAPGRGITLTNGTLVIPTEGRDKAGLPFSAITWSKDSGTTWTTSTPAYTNTNECAVVELSDHSLMLNMRERSNRGRMEGNGRAITVTRDLGQSWTEHPTSRKALIEPACMASLHRHFYTENGKKKSVLFFLNPSSATTRNRFTLKTSFDDGQTWPEANWLLVDEYNGNGYSCITSINEQTIGILYEGSQADMTFQQIPINYLIKK